MSEIEGLLKPTQWFYDQEPFKSVFSQVQKEVDPLGQNNSLQEGSYHRILTTLARHPRNLFPNLPEDATDAQILEWIVLKDKDRKDEYKIDLTKFRQNSQIVPRAGDIRRVLISLVPHLENIKLWQRYIVENLIKESYTTEGKPERNLKTFKAAITYNEFLRRVTRELEVQQLKEKLEKEGGLEQHLKDLGIDIFDDEN